MGLSYSIITTDLINGRYRKMEHIRPGDNEPLIILSHHGHAWLGLPIYIKILQQPTDCHCGNCVRLPASHGDKCRACE